MDFAGITIPEGRVKKITVGGVVLWEKRGYTNLAEPLPNNTTDTSKWVNGYRISSSGVSAQSGKTVCNPIPFKTGDVIRIKGVSFVNSTDRAMLTGGNYTAGHVVYVSSLPDSQIGYKLNGDVHEFTIISTISAYTHFRCAFTTPTNPENIIITVNEEIANGTDEIINLLPTALTPNDIATVFDGIGYKNGYYASAASPYYNTDTAFFCTGLMVIPHNGTFYVKGCTIDTSLSHTRFGLMKEDGGLINTAVIGSWGNGIVVEKLGEQYYSITINSSVITTVPHYFYFSASGTGEGVIVSHTPIE